MPQPVVEFQTIEHHRTIGQAEDVTGHQIAVPVDDPAVGDALCEQHRPSGDELCRERPDHAHVVRGEHGSDVLLQRGQRVLPAIDDSVKRTGFVDRRAAIGPLMERRQHLRDRIQMRLGDPARLGHRRQSRGIRVAPHHHDRFARPALGIGEVRDADVAVT